MCVQCDFKTTLWECILWLLDSLSEFVMGNIWTPWKCIKLDICTPYGSLFSVTFRHSMELCFLVFFNTLWLCLAWLPDTLWVCSVRILDTMGACLMTFWTFNGSVFGVNFFYFWALYESLRWLLDTLWECVQRDFLTTYKSAFSVNFGLLDT